MGLKEDLTAEVNQTFRDQWTTREGIVVPDPEDLKLGNDAVHFDRATVLYADMDGSTNMVDKSTWYFAAEVYKAYLYCAGRLIRNERGVITAYDGDRVMGVFIGKSQSTDAARCGLKINYMVTHIINPAIRKEYSKPAFELKQVVGIDTSEMRVARTGVRGDNDLVWVGRAANYAAKLTSLSSDWSTRITKTGFDRLANESKYGGSENELMWENVTWTDMGGMEIYRSNWWWRI